MKCKKCKAEIPEDAQFCYHCGYEVPQQAPKKRPLKPIVIAAALLALGIIGIVIWRIAA
ncbi:MAG: zinc ribbon domain-containing protein [Spirochaetales bacterium]|jgi:predicted nucleic acid-binding Zn ribbon protein|nr:zinc ribbon domain-containing protein [Spirochaetales bacterium]